MTTMKEQTAAIRKAIKAKCKTLSVRRGTGTAYSWIEISGTGEMGEFTDAEKRALESLGLKHGGNFAVISPDDPEYWTEKLTGAPARTYDPIPAGSICYPSDAGE